VRIRWLGLIGFVAMSLCVPALARAIDNTGEYKDDGGQFTVRWDPRQFAVASVATGGILLSRDAAVLFIGPDDHENSDDCVDARVQIDMLEAPLLFAYAYDLPAEPEVSGIGASQSAVYAWPDGIVHFAWFGCIANVPGSNVVLRLLARTENWGHAVSIFQPVLDTLTITGTDGTPVASPAVQGTPSALPSDRLVW
jgi:hypothetical protein